MVSLFQIGFLLVGGWFAVMGFQIFNAAKSAVHEQLGVGFYIVSAICFAALMISSQLHSIHQALTEKPKSFSSQAPVAVLTGDVEMPKEE